MDYPARPRQTIAAILPTYRRWPHLLSTVEQLLAQTVVPDQILVADQTPREEVGSAELSRWRQLRGRHRWMIYVHQAVPHVYRARNLAARRATADLLLYLDDDVVLDPQLVEHQLTLLADPAIDAVVGRVLTPGVDRLHLPYPPQRVSAARRAFCFGQYRDDVRVERISYCAAGHFCVRRRVLAEIGGWDEHVLTYGDKDMGLRMYAAGKNVIYDPHPTLTHLAVSTGGTRLTDPRAPWPAWQRAVSIHYVAIRHLHGADFWRYGMVRAAKHTFLLRRNALRPWRWPSEMWGYVKGLAVAWRWSRQGVLSSFPA